MIQSLIFLKIKKYIIFMLISKNGFPNKKNKIYNYKELIYIFRIKNKDNFHNLLFIFT
jgi:hypothetical protein